MGALTIKIRIALSLSFLAPGVVALNAASQFAFRDVNATSVELTEQGKPVFVYNHGMMLAPGAPERYRRSSYVHPVYAPDGTVLTDDFPKDHYHHRGIFWAWPIVKIGDEVYDLWAIGGIHQRFVRWIARDAQPGFARIAVENGWFIGEKKIVKEIVDITVHPAKANQRQIDFTLTFTPLDRPIQLSSPAKEHKSYGGFNVRFAPRDHTVIRTEAGVLAKDTDLIPHEWAELEAVFQGRRASVRIDSDPSNPGTPQGWCLRHYGFLGPGFPGPTLTEVQPGKPLTLKYKVTLSARGPAGSGFSSVRWDIDRSTGRLNRIETLVGTTPRSWLAAPVALTLRNEASSQTAWPTQTQVRGGSQPGEVDQTLEENVGPARYGPITLRERFRERPGGLAWDLDFQKAGPRTGYEVVLDLPVLSRGLQIFTPSDRGVVEVSRHPTSRPVPYGKFGWNTGLSYTLPLVSVMDSKADSALTVALPPDQNIPHLEVEWIDAKTLRLIMAHRGVGDGKPSPLRLRLYAHPADYRSALKAYSDDFPAYFRPTLPPNEFDGAFWYHHIEEHPSFAEMERQNVRYVWSSFWFPFMGNFMPETKEWYPFSYARHFKLGAMMSDEKLNRFIEETRQHRIAFYAYFNVTEFGGRGGRNGDSSDAERLLNGPLAGIQVRDVAGRVIPSWEECVVVNPSRRLPLYPWIQEQVRRHLDRLPNFEGFIIDRLDWASDFDYGHDDGFSRFGARAVENLAVPVADAVQEVCRLAHAAGKRVVANQFYRVEVLRDVDGVCHENDYVRGLGYVTPYRPASAWHMRKAYDKDLLEFESQLKLRLQFALQPQMIAHEFKISQQAPNARAADLLEIYALLFRLLSGKQQVLLPHPVSVTGANDANLFTNGSGDYVIPVTSRIRFLTRRTATGEPVTVKLGVPGSPAIKWAHVYSADSGPYRAALSGSSLSLKDFRTAAVIVAGKRAEPALQDGEASGLAAVRDRLVPLLEATPTEAGDRSYLANASAISLQIEGIQAGERGGVDVSINGKHLGRMFGSASTFPVDVATTEALRVRFTTGDEGTWFVPERVQLLAQSRDGQLNRVAGWKITVPNHVARSAGDFEIPLR